jgi:hypothetical protein
VLEDPDNHHPALLAHHQAILRARGLVLSHEANVPASIPRLPHLSHAI